MRLRSAGPLAFGVAAAILAHAASVLGYPYFAMRGAMRQIDRHGERTNAWVHARRASPESRAVVRPSPDFAYSVCVFDLARGPVRIHVAPAPGYWSLSLYASNSDNFGVWNDHALPDGADLLLIAPRQPTPTTNAFIVRSPSSGGIAVIRRLAPTDADWKQISAIRKEDTCATAP